MGQNDQRFGFEYLYRETNPSGGAGWVLTAMDVIFICDIGRNKSELRNNKNQNFEIAECWNRFQSAGTPFRVLKTPSSTRKARPGIEKKLGWRMDALGKEHF